MTFDGGDVQVGVSPDLSSFLGKLTTGMNGLLPGITQASNLATKGVAVGLGVAAIAATKMALDFDDAFTRISAVSNASAEDIATWRDQVLELAGETAQAPRELADALYFLSSAGLSASQVTETLEVSAKASAVGLGETADIARLTAQALNAYAQSGLTARGVTDTLVAAVREGTAEPDEFADALGRILPIASRAGIGFDEVTASLAALSNIGLDVNEGVTAMRGLLQALVTPGSQAADALAQVGISSSEMRDVLESEGLLAALQLLEERTGGNIEVLRDIVPNIRALTGELALTGENAEKVVDIFASVSNATGSLDDAFKATAEGPMFAFRQVLAEGEATLIRFGEALVPVAAAVAGLGLDVLRPVSDLIASNTELITALVTAFLGFQAIRFVPGLLRGIAGGLAAMQAASLASLGEGLFKVALGLEAVGAARAADAFADAAAGTAGLGSSAAAALGPLALLVVTVHDLYAAVSAFREGGVLPALAAELNGWAASLIAASPTVGGFIAGIGDLAQGLVDAGKEGFDGFEQGLHKVREAMQAGAIDIDEAEIRIGQLADAMGVTLPNGARAMAEALRAGIGRELRANTFDALQGILDFEVALNQTRKSGESIVSTFDLFGQVLLDNTKLTLGQKAAVAAQIDSIYELGGSLSIARQAWLDQELAAGNFNAITGVLSDQIDRLNEKLAETGQAGEKSFSELLERGVQLASALGLSFDSLRESAFDAFIADGRAFGENFDKLIGEISAKLENFRGEIRGAVDFTAESLANLSEAALKSPEDILEAFNAAKEATRDFGRDLLEISSTGGAAGRSLATQLLALGPAGVTAADTIAGASDRMRDKIIGAFAEGQGAADALATKLTRRIAGTLGDIRTLLEQIARKWGIDVDVDDNGGLNKLRDIQDTISSLPASKVIQIKIEQSGRDIGAFADGTSNFPGVGIVGERGPELLIAPQGSRIIPNHALPRGGGGSATSRLVVLEGKVDVDSGRIRAIAREEDDEELRYRRGLGAMR